MIVCLCHHWFVKVPPVQPQRCRSSSLHLLTKFDVSTSSLPSPSPSPSKRLHINHFHHVHEGVCIYITFCTLEMQFYRTPIPTWPHLGSTCLRKLKASLIWWWQWWEDLAVVHLCALLPAWPWYQATALFHCFCDLEVFICVFRVLALVQIQVGFLPVPPDFQ